jgi:CRISPR-associated protein Csh1
LLEAIKALGEYEIEKEGLKDIDIFVEGAELKNTKKVICIVFKKNGKIITYDHTHIESYDPSKVAKYLYKTTRHNRYNVTPTTKIKKVMKGKGKKAEINIEGTIQSVKKRLLLWLRTYEARDQLISSLKNAFENKEKSIWDDFAQKYEELKVDKKERIDEKANSILTIKIIENDKEQYLGDIDIFKRIFIEEAEKGFYYKFGIEAKGSGFCYICKKPNKEVFGFALPFSFYTVDKRGFAPEFLRKNSWKQLPICKECAKHIHAGKKFLDNYLKKRFYHEYQFYVIPHFIKGEIDEGLIEEIKRGEREEEYKGLLTEDDYLLEPIKEKGGVLTLIFMFIKPKQGRNFDIVRYVEDVPPSWIKKLYDTLQHVNNLSIFKEESLKKIGVVGKKKSGDLKDIDRKGTRMGGLVEAFFPHSRETGVYSKYFIDIIGDILAQRPINKNLLMRAFTREIRNRYYKGENYEEKLLSLKSLMLLLFLNRLHLIKG